MVADADHTAGLDRIALLADHSHFADLAEVVSRYITC